MNDLGVHALLFLAISVAIVAFGAMYAEPHDPAALRSFPRRWMYFAGGCLLLAGIMLVLEHTLARVA